MNIDILDQLVWLGVNTMDNHVDDTCRAAADEIMRLRAELNAEGNDSNLLMLEIERLRAEIERLRSAGDELLVCTFASAGRDRVLAARTAWNKEARRG